MESKKVHIVSSSGGIRCLSYIGAFQKLKESNIEIASISACSMGTVLGAMVCAGMDIQKIEDIVLNYKFSNLKRKKMFAMVRAFFPPFAIQKTPDYAQIVVDLIGEDITLGQMKIPFSVAALDIRQKRFLVYSSESHPNMKLSETIKIATAIPFLYQPYKLGKRVLVDAALASESPVWMAANNPGNYPIIVLKPLNPPEENYQKSLPAFLSGLFMATAKSHDHFTMSLTSRAIEIGINCEAMSYDNFDINKDQIENLILQGQSATEQRLKEFNYNFNNILDIEEVESSVTATNDENKAEILANQMITGYQNEIMQRNQVFVSYSHADKEWMLKMRTHLKSLERFLGIKAWDDTSIKSGDEWNKEIVKALISTRVAVFLVTPNFLASDFIQDKEMGYFLEISEKEKVPILWVAVSSSTFEHTPLEAIQCANDPRKPLDSLSSADQNAEFTKICNKIVSLMGAGKHS